MPTTSNFGWTTPADTDLVKDGALAIRTLGNGVDTSMAQLKGGTTGQVLSKTSNTDMAFTWVTQDDANAIQNAIVDAKGDLIAASANDTPARLAVGNNGETLLADSAATTGLRWTARPSASNPVINSAFQVWQRGTSFTANTGYTADRWYKSAAAGRTFSRQTTSDTTNLPNIQYAMRMQRDSGNTATDNVILSQSFETANAYPYIGKTVTISFYARAGANYSAASGNFISRLYTGTGTDQNVEVSYTGSSAVINQTSTLTTTWQRFSYSGTIGTTATEFALWFAFTPVGTAGAADYAEITGVQIDIGSVALPFRTYANTLAGELAACQRYYQRITATSTYYRFGVGQNVSATQSGFVVPFKTTMRTTPTFSSSGNFDTVEGTTSRGTNAPSLSSDGNNTESAFLFTTIASGTTAYAVQLRANNSTTTYVDFSAEL